MACRQIKKLLGYELCIFDREGTLFYSDDIVLIRKNDYTEIFNLDTMRHEIGDRIKRDVTRNTIYQYIRSCSLFSCLTLLHLASPHGWYQ